MQDRVIIAFKNETNRNTVIRCLEKHFNNGLTFDHSIKTAKEQEKIAMEIQPNNDFTNAMKKYDEQGICKYLSIPTQSKAITRSQGRKLLVQNIPHAFRFFNWLSQHFSGS